MNFDAGHDAGVSTRQRIGRGRHHRRPVRVGWDQVSMGCERARLSGSASWPSAPRFLALQREWIRRHPHHHAHRTRVGTPPVPIGLRRHDRCPIVVALSIAESAGCRSASASPITVSQVWRTHADLFRLFRTRVCMPRCWPKAKSAADRGTGGLCRLSVRRPCLQHDPVERRANTPGMSGRHRPMPGIMNALPAISIACRS